MQPEEPRSPVSFEPPSDQEPSPRAQEVSPTQDGPIDKTLSQSQKAARGFFLYVRHRMSGFGDSWQRWPRGDVEHYPLLKQEMAQMLAAREAVGKYQPPKAIGGVRYVGDTELNAEIADLRVALEAKPAGLSSRS
jgi:hypothetical protein